MNSSIVQYLPYSTVLCCQSKQALELRNIVFVVAVIKHHYHNYRRKEQSVCCHQYKMIPVHTRN
jgi:hypothetical protein